MSVRFGSVFEQVAVCYLVANGMFLLEKNFKCRLGEIDAIMYEFGESSLRGTMVFVEVKYRKNDKYGCSSECVTSIKKERILKTAEYYMIANRLSNDISYRFDLVAINKNRENIEWIKNILSC